MKNLKILATTALLITISILFVYFLGTYTETQRSDYDYYNTDLEDYGYDSASAYWVEEDNTYYFGETLPAVEVIAHKAQNSEP